METYYLQEQAALLKTRTFGFEVDGGVKVDAFNVNVIGTFQDGKITETALAPLTVENKIWRKPPFQFRIESSYDFQLSNNLSVSLIINLLPSLFYFR